MKEGYRKMKGIEAIKRTFDPQKIEILAHAKAIVQRAMAGPKPLAWFDRPAEAAAKARAAASIKKAATRLNDEQKARIVELRRLGFTFIEIGEKMGIHNETARQVFARTESGQQQGTTWAVPDKDRATMVRLRATGMTLQAIGNKLGRSKSVVCKILSEEALKVQQQAA